MTVTDPRAPSRLPAPAPPLRPVDPLQARGHSPTPPPHPAGWFAVARLAELPHDRPLTVQLSRRDVTVWRRPAADAAQGLPVAASEAICPHLGAHLGHGGRLRDGLLICPFHSFGFSADGICRSTPQTTSEPPTPPPPGARLATLPAAIRAGLVFVWDDPARRGQPPAWDLSADDGHLLGPDVVRTQWSFAGHPQDTTENSVDLAHFGALHGLRDVTLIEPLTADGPRLFTRYRAVRAIPGLPARWGIPADFTVTVEGLGFSAVEIRLPGRWHVRTLVLATPTDERHVILRALVSAHRSRPPGTSPAADRSGVASRLLNRLVARLALMGVSAEIKRDIPVWEHKHYLARPAIAACDGPLGRYRRWAAQFYTPTPDDHSLASLDSQGGQDGEPRGGIGEGA